MPNNLIEMENLNSESGSYKSVACMDEEVKRTCLPSVVSPGGGNVVPVLGIEKLRAVWYAILLGPRRCS